MIAYLDAGSGSLIASAIVAGFAGVLVFARRGWHRFLALFSPKRREQLRAEKARRAERIAAAEDVENAEVAAAAEDADTAAADR